MTCSQQPLPASLLHQAKRSRGAPKASKPGDKVTVSIVVTDVKDFSDLTRQYPEAMNKAMGVHNNILRKASHNHAGYIMDQEVGA
jgi:class 3 adenylate cyclase